MAPDSTHTSIITVFTIPLELPAAWEWTGDDQANAHGYEYLGQHSTFFHYQMLPSKR